MPTVPTYDNFQATPNTLPQARIGMPEMPDVAGQQAQQMGRGMSNLGQHLTAIATDMQREANATVAKDIDTQVTASYSEALYNPESGYMVQQGKNAVLGFEQTVQGLQDIRRKALDGIQSPAVRQMVEPVLNTRMQHALDAVARHSGQESRKYQIQTADSRATVSLQDAAMNYADDSRFAQAVAVAREETATLARLNGWDEATAQLQATKYQDHGFKMRYEAWRITDPAAAFAHFRRNAEQISPLAREQIGSQLFHAAAPVLAAQYNAAGGSGVVPSAQGVADPTAPRGVRNNNPGNIMKGGDNWQGEVQGNDPRYATFATPEAGIRAMGKTLLTYQEKHGLNSVEAIIARWAPATENNTAAYVATVAKEMGVKPDAALNLRDGDTLAKLTRAMIRVENGNQPYSDQQIAAGLAAATKGSPLPKASASAQGDPTAPTGYPDLDTLPADWRLHVLQLARSQAHQQMSEARESLRGRVQDATAAYLSNGFAPDAPNEGEFIQAYGQAEGVKRYGEFQGVAKLGQTLQQVKTLPTAALVDMVKTAKPTPGDGFAVRQQNYEKLVEAIGQVQKVRADDPVAYAIQTGSYGVRPIERFNDPKGFVPELSRRAGVARQMATDYSTPLQVMTKPEADAFAEYISSLQAPDKARVLGQVFTATGAAGIQSISTQLKDKHQSVAIAGMLTSFNTTAGNSAALLYLQGREAIEQKRAKIDETAEIGTKAEIYKAIDGVYQTPQGRDAAAEAAFGIYAKFKADGGGDIAQAVRIATGGIMEHNGSKIAKPYGWQDSQFRDALRNRVSVALAAQGGEYLVGGNRVSAADFSKMLPGARLQTYGQGSYLVMAGNDVVRTHDGAPFILKVGE
ncbi:hypothetical protein [Azonexus hydrophilus]|uniref:hypothetical protein n=1 Tax=Azonexus hydrophilus TaxID=418702 RepID=UPI00196442AA|nr:hypothetical protein [Azonexus hydrophilus]